MADVWEKDLAQKTSLTTSDFIRVVGSDNVSYKQSMASVANATGSVYLGAFSASSDEDAVKSALTALKNAYGYEASSTTNLPKTVAFMRSGAWGFVGVAWIRSNIIEMTAVRYTDGATYFGRDASGTQTVTLMPTRAEVDALNSTTDITITPTTNSNYTLTPQTPHLMRGNVVTIGLLIAQSSVASNYVQIGSIPTSCAPTAWCYFSPNSANAGCVLAIGSNGTIQLKGDIGASKYLTITYCR